MHGHMNLKKMVSFVVVRNYCKDTIL